MPVAQDRDFSDFDAGRMMIYIEPHADDSGQNQEDKDTGNQDYFF